MSDNNSLENELEEDEGLYCLGKLPEGIGAYVPANHSLLAKRFRFRDLGTGRFVSMNYVLDLIAPVPRYLV